MLPAAEPDALLRGLVRAEAGERAQAEAEALFAAHPGCLHEAADKLTSPDGGVPALLADLRSPNDQLQAAAVGTLAVASRHSPLAVQALAAAGGAQPLAHCLNSDSDLVAALAALALAHLAHGAPATRRTIAAAGAVPGLVHLLARSAVDLAPAALLRILADDSCELAQAVAAAGIVPSIAVVLRASTSVRVQGQLARALEALARRLGQPGRDAVAASGAVPALAGLLSSSNADMRAAACLALCSLFGAGGGSAEPTNARVAAAVASADGLAALVSLLGSRTAGEGSMAAHLLRAILVHRDVQIQQAAMTAGVIPALVAMSRVRAPEAPPTQEWSPGSDADITLYVLACHCDTATASAMVDGGAVPVLAAALHGQPGTQQLAAHSLAALAVSGSRRAVAEAGAIPTLRQLARESCNAEVQRAANTALLALSNSAATRAEVMSAVDATRQTLQQAFAWIVAPDPPVVAVPATARAVPDATQAISAAAPAADPSPEAAVPAAVAAATAPPQRTPRVCAAPGCGATSGLRRCGGCGAVRYCSEACSKAHWRAHKAECRRVEAERPAAAAAASQSASQS